MAPILHTWRFGALAFVGALIARLPTLWLGFTPGADEIAYQRYAAILRESGFAGLQKWMSEFGINHLLDKSPLPSRLLVIVLDATAAQVGGTGMGPLIAVSYLAGAGMVVVGALYARAIGVHERLLPWLVALLIVSPVATAMSRRALSDTVVGLMCLLVLYTFHLCWTRGTRGTSLALGASMLGALLAKETAALLFPLLLLAGLYYYFGMRLRLKRSAIWFLVLAAAIYGAILIALAGSLPRLVEVYRAYGAVLGQLPYTVQLEGGPWFAYFLDWLLISPIIFLLGMAGFVQLATPTHAQRLCLIFLVAGALLYAQLPAISVRHLIFLDPMLRIGALLFLGRLVTPAWPASRLPLLIALVAGTEVLQFYQFFVLNAIYDPVHMKLLEAMGFVTVITY